MLFARIASFVLRHRIIVALSLVALFGAAALGVSRVVIDFSARAFFGSDDPASIYLDEHLDRWGADDDEIYIVARAESGSVLTVERLDALAALAEELDADPAVGRVISPASVQVVRAPLQGQIDIRELRDTLPEDPAEQPAWREEMLADPLLVPNVLSVDGAAAVIFVELAGDTDRIEQVLPILDRLRGIIDRHQGVGGLSFLDGGVPSARASTFNRIIRDQLLLVPISMLLMALINFALFRSLYGVVVPTACAVSPLILLLGLMGYLGEPFSIINQVYTVLIPIIAVADAIHVVSRFREEVYRGIDAGESFGPELRNAAIVRAMGAVGTACLFTTATTVIGFLALRTADMRALKAFGTYAAFGLVSAFVLMLLLAPLLLSMVRGPGPRPRPTTLTERLLRRSARLSLARPAVVLSVTVVLSLGALLLGNRVVIDNFLTGSLPADDRAARANQALNEELGGVIALELDLSGPEGAFDDPAVLRTLHELADELNRHKDVRAVFDIGSLVARVNRLLTGRNEVPETARGVARNLLLIDGEDRLTQLRSIDASRTRLILRSVDAGGLRFEALSDHAAELIDERLAGFTERGISYQLSGTPYVAYRGINRLTADLRSSLISAFIVIGLILGLLFRSPRLLVLSFFPNSLPLLFGYGLLGAAGWYLEPQAAVLFTVALAIAVDDTIHLLARYREERIEGVEHRAAVSAAVIGAGRPVTVTSVMLCSGFLLITIASFPGNRIFGRLGFVAIGTAWLCDLFLLPALLGLFAGGTRYSAGRDRRSARN